VSLSKRGWFVRLKMPVFSNKGKENVSLVVNYVINHYAMKAYRRVEV
jgi:hypothetical protein